MERMEQQRGRLMQPDGARGVLLAVLWYTWCDLRHARWQPDWMPSRGMGRAYPIAEWREAGFATLADEVNDWIASVEFAGMCALLDLDVDWVRRVWQLGGADEQGT